ncbi:unnamed protein product [Mucor hiemalis]
MTDKTPKEEPLDLPPPYSPSQEDETSSRASPPNYHTIHEQLGYLDATSSSSSTTPIKQEPSTQRNKGKQRSDSNHGLFDDIRYDPRRGPIGNIFNIAEKFVGNAANAANVAIGAPPSPSPAEFGNNIARSATMMANNASRAAMGYVENIMGAQTSRRDERRERREIKREQKKERRDAREKVVVALMSRVVAVVAHYLNKAQQLIAITTSDWKSSSQEPL